jgi:hypothetical protein
VRGGRDGDDAGELARQRRLALAVIVATVALADLTPLDQFSMTLHMFTVGLIGLVVTPS